MENPDQRIEVRLPDEGAVIEGRLTPFSHLRILFKRAWRESLRFSCLCGADVDTSAMEPGELYRVDNGYLLQCAGCRRWYFHNCTARYVESVQADKNVVDSLFQRMPDEHGFIRGILAAPDNAGLSEEYADYLTQRGDSRAEVLRLKREIACTSVNDPRGEELRVQLEGLRTNLDPEWFALIVRMAPSALCLIGAGNDLAEMPQRLLPSVVNIRPNGEIQDGDYVVFCISCTDGPTAGTGDAIDRCRGHTIIPVGIILTKADLVANHSLQELVTQEGCDLMMRVLPPEIVDRLPVFYDFDPWLAEKLLTCICDAPEPVLCRKD